MTEIKITLNEALSYPGFMDSLAEKIANKMTMNLELYNEKELNYKTEDIILNLVKKEMKEDYMQQTIKKTVERCVSEEISKYLYLVDKLENKRKGAKE